MWQLILLGTLAPTLTSARIIEMDDPSVSFTEHSLVYDDESEHDDDDDNDKAKLFIVEFDLPTVVTMHVTQQESDAPLHRRSRHVLDYVRLLTEHQEEALPANIPVVTRYHYAFNGASVLCNQRQAEALRSLPHVVKVWEETVWHVSPSKVESEDTATTPTTTSIPISYRGQEWLNDSGMTGENVVIGIIDSGIVPENPTFADDGTYGEPPPTFVGTGCAFGNTAYNRNDQPFTCNRKILAAKCYIGSMSTKYDARQPCGGNGANLEEPFHFISARDDNGHGTHVASTAAGNADVVARRMDGSVIGTISGVAPRARLSIYKVLWNGVTTTTDVLAAIDDAVADGVDVINFSIGTSTRSPGDKAFLKAVQAGIVAVTSAGNSGPDPGTVGLPAAYPWMLSVAASHDQRGLAWGSFIEVTQPTSVKGLYEFSASRRGVMLTTQTILNFTGAIKLVEEPFQACFPISSNLTNHIALVQRGGCSFYHKFNNAQAAGAQAILVYNDGNLPDRMGFIVMDAVGTEIPGLFLNHTTGQAIADKLIAGEDVRVRIPTKSTAKLVVPFSSRGPNVLYDDSIIKPDVMAPGTQILAGLAPLVASRKGQWPEFGFMSGTSMASPHVAGLAALLKQAHPEWSPSAIKSAIMTTAQQDYFLTYFPESVPATPFDMGAGMVRANRALSPALVYDIDSTTYQAAFCSFDEVAIGNDTCADLVAKGLSTRQVDLNYPSVAASKIKGSQTFTRSIMNAWNGSEAMHFTAKLETDTSAMDITVRPCSFVLPFGKSMSVEITLSAAHNTATRDWVFGSLIWIGEEANLYNISNRGTRSSVCTTGVSNGRTEQRRLTTEGQHDKEGIRPWRRYLRSNNFFQHDVLASTVPSLTFSEPPSLAPTSQVMEEPSMGSTPTMIHSDFPSTILTSIAPSTSPSVHALPFDSFEPSYTPSTTESTFPTNLPSDDVMAFASVVPSTQPTSTGTSTSPSVNAPPLNSLEPSSVPSSTMPAFPTDFPSVSPSALPSASMQPSKIPSSFPSMLPSASVAPSGIPSAAPSISSAPSAAPRFTIYSPIAASFEILKFPKSIKTTSSSGELSIPLTSYSSGDYSASLLGFSPPTVINRSIGPYERLSIPVQVASRRIFVKFILDSESDDDLDLIVYNGFSSQVAGRGEQLGPREEISFGPYFMSNGVPEYRVEIVSFYTATNSIPFTFSYWVVDMDSVSNPEVQVAAPTSFPLGESSIDLSWSVNTSLANSTVFYGAVSHTRNDSWLGYTFVQIFN